MGNGALGMSSMFSSIARPTAEIRADSLSIRDGSGHTSSYRSLQPLHESCIYSLSLAACCQNHRHQINGSG